MVREARAGQHVVAPSRAAGGLEPVGLPPVELHRAGHQVAALRGRFGVERAPRNAVLEGVATAVGRLQVFRLEERRRHHAEGRPFGPRQFVVHPHVHLQAGFLPVGVVPQDQVRHLRIVDRLETGLVDRIPLRGINHEAELAGVGVPAKVAFDLRILPVHQRRGIAHLGAHVERLGVIHLRELRALHFLGLRHHEHLDLAGEIPVIELAVDHDFARRRHRIHLLVPPQAGLGLRRNHPRSQRQRHQESHCPSSFAAVHAFATPLHFRRSSAGTASNNVLISAPVNRRP